MGYIGNFGESIVFETSDQKILTFSGMTQKIHAEYATHKVIGRKPLKEFSNPGSRSVSFTITLSAMHGVKPREMMKRIEKAVEEGRAEYLVIGGKPVGENRFVITNIQESWDIMLPGGELAQGNVNVTMEEYV